MLGYLDTVDKIRTPTASNVPQMQLNALMGVVSDAMNATIVGEDSAAEPRPP